MKTITKALPMVLVLLPSMAFAQLTSTQKLIESLGRLVQTLTLVVAGIALLVFFWGLARFILRIGGDEKAVEEGKSLMKWGLIALFVMVSVWGILRFIGNELLPGADFTTPPGLFGPGGSTPTPGAPSPGFSCPPGQRCT